MYTAKTGQQTRPRRETWNGWNTKNENWYWQPYTMFGYTKILHTLVRAVGMDIALTVSLSLPSACVTMPGCSCWHISNMAAKFEGLATFVVVVVVIVLLPDCNAWQPKATEQNIWLWEQIQVRQGINEVLLLFLNWTKTNRFQIYHVCKVVWHYTYTLEFTHLLGRCCSTCSANYYHFFSLD